MKIAGLVFALMLTLFSLQAASAPQSKHAVEAQTVLLRYLDALAQGDTDVVRSLLGGDLLEKRRRLLENPTYSGYLIDTYGSARFSIDNIEDRSPDSVAIDISVIIDQATISQRRFLLQKEQSPASADAPFRIFGETNPDTQ